MGKKLEKDAGAIYRYYRGELRTLYTPWTIPNAQCFSPNRDFAYLTDTPNGEILRQRLDPKDGWPLGDPEVFITLPESDFRPDGAVVDAEGRIWIAHYGHAKITCHDADGTLVDQIKMPANCITCPAFGGMDGTYIIRNNRGTGLYARSDERRSHGGTDIRDGVGRQRTTGTSGNLIKGHDMKVLIIGGGGVIGQKLGA
jgi:sugar lactone lactonase YvrE